MPVWQARILQRVALGPCRGRRTGAMPRFGFHAVCEPDSRLGCFFGPEGTGAILWRPTERSNSPIVAAPKALLAADRLGLSCAP